MGPYRRIYRHLRKAFASAGDGAICGATTLTTSLSINLHFILQASSARGLKEWHIESFLFSLSKPPAPTTIICSQPEMLHPWLGWLSELGFPLNLFATSE